ncbi:MAG: YgcG family protein [Pseudomonadota bacterium]
MNILFILFMCYWQSCALAEVAVPPLTARVIDQTATLDSQQLANLEQKLQGFETRKGSQLVVLMVPTTEPEAIEQYALRVVDQWKLGRKKIDDGVLLIIAKNDRALRIEVGYGLEGVLNDAIAKRIIAETITPHFKQGDFYSGITAGVDQIIRVVDGEPLPEPRAVTGTTNKGIQQYLPVIIVAALVIGGILRSIFGKIFGSIATGGIVAVVAWMLVGVISIAFLAGIIALIFTLMGGGGGRGMGGFGGGFGSGGFGGGGFGGGGGGFGGGGASGRW